MPSQIDEMASQYATQPKIRVESRGVNDDDDDDDDACLRYVAACAREVTTTRLYMFARCLPATNSAAHDHREIARSRGIVQIAREGFKN
jgi:hypothetical protein